MGKRGTLKKILIYTIYSLLALICIFFIFILIYNSSSRENDNIVKAQDSDSYFRSENPSFLVDFVNGEYIRFESVSSYSNPLKVQNQVSGNGLNISLVLNRKEKV